MEVHLCGAQGPVLTWQIAKAMPVKLSASSFDAKTNEVAIETLEVRAAGIAVRRRAG
jgi:phage tail-like protein